VSRSGEQLVWALAGIQGRGWGSDKISLRGSVHSFVKLEEPWAKLKF